MTSAQVIPSPKIPFVAAHASYFCYNLQTVKLMKEMFTFAFVLGLGLLVECNSKKAERKRT